MYGDTTDPLVGYYDLAFGITSQDEMAFFTDLMDASQGPILDLAGGTGRFTVEGASRNRRVVYVDASPGMYAQAVERVAALEGSLRNRVRLQRVDMNEFPLDEQYGLVICVDAFFHVLEPDRARRLLERVRDALAPGGIFAFNIRYTLPPFLCYAAREESSKWHSRGNYTDTRTQRKVEVQQSLEVDFESQIISTKLRFLELDQDGKIQSDKTSEWKTRYYHRLELEYLLELSGFRTRSVQGSYDGGPV